MQEMTLFSMDSGVFGAAFRFNQKTPEFLVVGNQIVQGEVFRISLQVASPHAMAAVSRHRVKPGRQSVRTSQLAKMFKRSKEDFLHGVLRILAMPTHLH